MHALPQNQHFHASERFMTCSIGLLVFFPSPQQAKLRIGWMDSSLAASMGL